MPVKANKNMNNPLQRRGLNFVLFKAFSLGEGWVRLKSFIKNNQSITKIF
jgi:hypothetical protein